MVCVAQAQKPADVKRAANVRAMSTLSVKPKTVAPLPVMRAIRAPVAASASQAARIDGSKRIADSDKSFMHAPHSASKRPVLHD